MARSVAAGPQTVGPCPAPDANEQGPAWGAAPCPPTSRVSEAPGRPRLRRPEEREAVETAGYGSRSESGRFWYRAAAPNVRVLAMRAYQLFPVLSVLWANGCTSQVNGDAPESDTRGNTWSEGDGDEPEPDTRGDTRSEGADIEVSAPTSDSVDVTESDEYDCWVRSAVTQLDAGVCDYSSASAQFGSVTVSGYWSMIHPHTCYLQPSDVDDSYDGGCDGGGVSGMNTQFLMNYECDGVSYSSGWLDAAEYDGYCGIDHNITACEIQTRALDCH